MPLSGRSLVRQVERHVVVRRAADHPRLGRRSPRLETASNRQNPTNFRTGVMEARSGRVQPRHPRPALLPRTRWYRPTGGTARSASTKPRMHTPFLGRTGSQASPPKTSCQPRPEPTGTTRTARVTFEAQLLVVRPAASLSKEQTEAIIEALAWLADHLSPPGHDPGNGGRADRCRAGCGGLRAVRMLALVAAWPASSASRRLLLGRDLLGWTAGVAGSQEVYSNLRTADWSRVASPGRSPRRSLSSATTAWSSVVWAGKSTSTVRATTGGSLPLFAFPAGSVPVNCREITSRRDPGGARPRSGPSRSSLWIGGRAGSAPVATTSWS